MRSPKRWIFGFLLLGLFVECIGPASAHAPDEYGHNTYVSITPNGLQIEMHLTPGPLIGAKLESIIDTNQDSTFSDREIQHYGEQIATELSVTVDNVERPVTLLSLSKPTPLQVRSGAAELVLTAVAAGAPPVHKFEFTDNHTMLRGPAQASLLDNNNLPSDLSIDRSTPRAITVTGTFASLNATAALTNDTPPRRTSSTNAARPANIATKRTKRLQNLLLNSSSFGAIAFALGVAALLGALHALTPGHGKTIAAAYLIGERATVRHAIVLGLSVTITHTSSVLILGAIAIGLAGRVDPASLTNTLRWGSGAIVLAIGLTLLAKRTRVARNNANPHAHVHSHDAIAHNGDHAHPHHGHEATDHTHRNHTHGGHTHGGLSHARGVVPDPVGVRRLVALGASGGLIPCPEALGVLIVAVSLHRQLFGMAMIIAFSVGLASVLIAVGIALVRARSILERFAAFPAVIANRWLPIFSAAVVSLLGLAILSGHVV